MPHTLTSGQQLLHKNDDQPYTYQDEEEVRAFLAHETVTALALEEAIPIVRDVFGASVKPMLIVARDPDGPQYDRLMALVPVGGEIDFALDLLSEFRRRWFDKGMRSSDNLCIDVEIV